MTTAGMERGKNSLACSHSFRDYEAKKHKRLCFMPSWLPSTWAMRSGKSGRHHGSPRTRGAIRNFRIAAGPAAGKEPDDPTYRAPCRRAAIQRSAAPPTTNLLYLFFRCTLNELHQHLLVQIFDCERSCSMRWRTISPRSAVGKLSGICMDSAPNWASFSLSP